MLSRLYQILSLVLFAMVLFGVSSCNSCQYEKPDRSNVIGMSKTYCDESFANIVEEQVGVFEFRSPEASIIPYYMDSESILDSIIDLKIDLGITASKLPEDAEEFLRKKNGACVTQRIAVDAIALIVNKENPVDSISMSQLKGILSGKYPTWKSLGYNYGDSINLIFDNPKSSVLEYAMNLLPEGTKLSKKVYAQGNSLKQFSAISKGKNNFGMIGVTWLCDKMNGFLAPTAEKFIKRANESDSVKIDKDSQVKVLKIYQDNSKIAYQPYQQHIYDGTYPLFRNIYAICTTSGGAPAKGFFDFITSPNGQKLILHTGIMPSVVYPRTVSLN